MPARLPDVVGIRRAPQSNSPARTAPPGTTGERAAGEASPARPARGGHWYPTGRQPTKGAAVQTRGARQPPPRAVKGCTQPQGAQGLPLGVQRLRKPWELIWLCGHFKNNSNPFPGSPSLLLPARNAPTTVSEPSYSQCWIAGPLQGQRQEPTGRPGRVCTQQVPCGHLLRLGERKEGEWFSWFLWAR